MTSAVLSLFVRTVFASLRRRARQQWSIDRGQCGAVTFLQRFGDALNANVHFHSLVLDGSTTPGAGKRRASSRSPRPTMPRCRTWQRRWPASSAGCSSAKASAPRPMPPTPTRSRPRSRRARRACSAGPWHWPFVPRAAAAGFGSSCRAFGERVRCRASHRPRRYRARPPARARAARGRRRALAGAARERLLRVAHRAPPGALPAPRRHPLSRIIRPHRGRGSPVLASHRKPAAARSRSRGSVAAPRPPG